MKDTMNASEGNPFWRSSLLQRSPHRDNNNIPGGWSKVMEPLVRSPVVGLDSETVGGKAVVQELTVCIHIRLLPERQN